MLTRSSCLGKSSITLRLVRSQWTHEYDPTIEDSYSVTRNIDGLPYLLSLTDTAGQEEYRGLWAASNLKSDAFLLVYDITNPSTLDALGYFMEMIDLEADQRAEDNDRKRKAGGGGDLEKMPVKIVVGNKCDLKENRQVSAREGLEYARKNGCGFMETSAREMVNIEETFALIVRRVVEARRNQTRTATASTTKPTNRNNPAAEKSHHAHSSSFSTTKPLPPITEKERKEAEGSRGRGKWWRRLACWR
ncbi:MAG: hypothetical protein Q9227_008078 [Pyrenula ochraceoflavens]